jgi:single-strand DNA-binding protein
MWVSCALWGKRGDALAPYLKKGSKVTVSGQIKLRTYQKKDGTPGTELTLNVQNIDLNGSNQASEDTKPAGEAAKADGYQPQPKGDIQDMDDDIPF